MPSVAAWLKRVAGYPAVLLMLASTVLIIAGLVEQAAAHSSLITASPAPGVEVGPFAEIRLEFADAISPDGIVQIDLRDSEGILLEALLGETERVDAFTIRAGLLDSLPGDGEYLVFYQIETNDQDGLQESGYEFAYSAHGAPAEFVSTLPEPETSASPLELAGYFFALAGVIGILFWFSPWRPATRKKLAGE
ncbi:MAG: copper resistance protein CopC [Acidimicrobiales bacterium]